jgi:hypothetical protein
MIRRVGATATGRSRSVPTCAKWLFGLLAGACLNPMPDEYPSVYTSERSGPPAFADQGSPNASPEGSLADDPLFPEDEFPIEPGRGIGAGGASSAAEPDAGAPASDGGLTTRTTNTRLRGARDAGADAQ